MLFETVLFREAARRVAIPPYIDPILPAIAVKSVFRRNRIRCDASNLHARLRNYYNVRSSKFIPFEKDFLINLYCCQCDNKISIISLLLHYYDAINNSYSNQTFSACVLSLQ
ncbi:hypothetical protein PUN28_002298 [Cardiocondyla obscurior]|uniref:Uncharacterized protein n=1 Tax=Cardiocondyla obscurior TaxID=286306 RepID=A0AAW2GTM9_9HYME